MTEAINMTYENNVFYCTKNGTKWISIDGEKWYGEEKRIAELENKIADIKANCDLAIEGRDIKIKELEQENNKLLDVINNQDVKIADLEEELKEWKDEWQEQVQKAIDEGYARTLQTMQLTKSKEIIKNLLSAYTTYADSFDDRDNEIVDEAEQFLKDLEK